MSSSDSEEDCYGNIAQRLQNMKNNYLEDKIETTNLLEESTDLDESLKKKTKSSPKKKAKIAQEDTANSSTSHVLDNSQESAQNSSRRTTRSKANSSDLPAQNLPPQRSSRRNASETESPSRGRGRGRARGRGRGSWRVPRGRRRPRTIADFLMALYDPSNDDDIPTYSVGNTEDYPDESDSQALFSQKKPEVVEETDPLDDNEELSVKVYWQSSEFFKFNIRRYQKLTQIFDYFTKKHDVSHDNLLLTYNDTILKPDDTPDSIDYNIGKFIDGGIVNQSVSQFVTKEEKIKDGVKIKFQCQKLKKPFEITIRLDDKFSLAMMKCAEQLEMPLDRLKFEFDGDSISGKSTARELELEGGECIDVKMLS